MLPNYRYANTNQYLTAQHKRTTALGSILQALSYTNIGQLDPNANQIEQKEARATSQPFSGRFQLNFAGAELLRRLESYTGCGLIPITTEKHVGHATPGMLLFAKTEAVAQSLK